MITAFQNIEQIEDTKYFSMSQYFIVLPLFILFFSCICSIHYRIVSMFYFCLRISLSNVSFFSCLIFKAIDENISFFVVIYISSITFVYCIFSTSYFFHSLKIFLIYNCNHHYTKLYLFFTRHVLKINKITFVKIKWK